METNNQAATPAVGQGDGPKQATKKPVTIWYFRYDGRNSASILFWIGSTDAAKAALPNRLAHVNDAGDFLIRTLESGEGYHVVSPGDYVIQGVKGEFYPCKPEIFEASYVQAEARAAIPQTPPASEFGVCSGCKEEYSKELAEQCDSPDIDKFCSKYCADAVKSLEAIPQTGTQDERLLRGALNMMAFMRSCLLSGEKLGDHYEKQVDDFLAKLKARAGAIPQTESPRVPYPGAYINKEEVNFIAEVRPQEPYPSCHDPRSDFSIVVHCYTTALLEKTPEQVRFAIAEALEKIGPELQEEVDFTLKVERTQPGVAAMGSAEPLLASKLKQFINRIDHLICLDPACEDIGHQQVQSMLKELKALTDPGSASGPQDVEKLAEQLHIWYLEAVENLDPDSYNAKAKKPYTELTEFQKSVDRFIAGKIMASVSPGEGEPSKYDVDGDDHELVTVERRSKGWHFSEDKGKVIDGHDHWSINKRGFCLNRDLEWEYEPIPSSRDEAYIQRTRWKSAAEAIKFYNGNKSKLGLTLTPPREEK